MIYPVPDDEGDGAFEGLFHLGLAVIVWLGFWRGRFGMDTRTSMLEKWLAIY